MVDGQRNNHISALVCRALEDGPGVKKNRAWCPKPLRLWTKSAGNTYPFYLLM